MFVMFTNANPPPSGDDAIAVNPNMIRSVFEVTLPEEAGDRAGEKITVLFGGPEGSVEVKESFLEVVGRLKAGA